MIGLSIVQGMRSNLSRQFQEQLTIMLYCISLGLQICKIKYFDQWRIHQVCWLNHIGEIMFDKTRNILTNWYFILHVGGLLQMRSEGGDRNQKARSQSIQQRGGHLLSQSRIWSTFITDFDTGSEMSTSFPPKWIKYHSVEGLRRVGWNINLWVYFWFCQT